MPQSLAQIYLQLIFSTKGREPFVADDGIRKEMHAYLASIMKEYDSPALIIGGTADHVHLLCMLSRTETIAKIVGEAKRSSSKWIKTKGGGLARFQWQNGYGAFSVSASKLGEVRNYIANQMQDNQRISFQEEYRLFLRKHGVEFDERYVWD
jgi:REP element-mobilizing transposase RayT